MLHDIEPAARFLAWYLAPHEHPEVGRALLEDATYDVGTDQLTIEEFVWGVENGARPERVRLLDEVCSPGGAAYLFEFLDPVTLLHHRQGLFVSIDGGRIRRVRDVSMIRP